jgi:phosphoglycerate dehydrogenase-like enzyme
MKRKKLTPDNCVVHFLHPAYRFAEEFSHRNLGIRHFQSWSVEESLGRLQDTDVLVVSGLWKNDLLNHTPRLQFIQVSGAGYDQFDLPALRNANIRLSHAAGVNSNAVSEHAMALILTFSRQLHLARDRQGTAEWRGMISNAEDREAELSDKMIVVVGLGNVGMRIARLAKAFEMRVVGLRRKIDERPIFIDELNNLMALDHYIRLADFVVLACPLTEETRGLIGPKQLSSMKKTAFFINVARGGCVDEVALIDALRRGDIAGAGIDSMAREPLPAASPLWNIRNVVITPHTGGETQLYERNTNDVLIDNLRRLFSAEPLRNVVI